jgi:hypothetical protein
MSINSILSTGMQGIQTGIDRSDRAGARIAGFGADLDSGNVAPPLIDLKVGELQVKAAAAVVKTGDQLLGALIDIRA